jgi:hypothetical protein
MIYDSVQFCATRRESEISKTPSVRNDVQRCENLRNSLGSNYKSGALPGGLQTLDIVGFLREDRRQNALFVISRLIAEVGPRTKPPLRA